MRPANIHIQLKGKGTALEYEYKTAHESYYWVTFSVGRLSEVDGVAAVQ